MGSGVMSQEPSTGFMRPIRLVITLLRSSSVIFCALAVMFMAKTATINNNSFFIVVVVCFVSNKYDATKIMRNAVKELAI
jgi:hypothetical protein